MKTLKLKLIYSNAITPKRASFGSVGYDLFAYLDTSINILPGETVSIGTGVAIALEQGYAAFIYARSGLGIKHGIIPANCVGVIDSDYRGEIMVGVKNSSNSPFTIEPFERIAQLVIKKCIIPNIEICEELDMTQRGEGGFGSSGRR